MSLEIWPMAALFARLAGTCWTLLARWPFSVFGHCCAGVLGELEVWGHTHCSGGRVWRPRVVPGLPLALVSLSPWPL